MDSKLRERFNRVEVLLSRNGPVFQKDTRDWQETVKKAKTLINHLESVPQARSSLGIPRWINFVGLLQRLAYVDPDDGAEVRIASWCEEQWAEVLQSHPQNVPALQGLGHVWLLKCQRVLAQIYRDDIGLPGQGSPGLGRSRAVRPLTHTIGCITEEDIQKINSPSCGEARSLLRPSLESLDRAIEAADLQGAMTGQLFELAAEAYLSFGNVSHPRNNEICYQKSLNFLQRASQIEGYIMDPYLSSYLQQNIQFISVD